MKNKANIWWNSLSINEQNYYISLHPFYSKMGNDYFLARKNSVKDLYEYLKEQEIIMEDEKNRVTETLRGKVKELNTNNPILQTYNKNT